MTSTPTPAPEPTTQERLAWMGKNSKQLIIALVVLIIAALVVDVLVQPLHQLVGEPRQHGRPAAA